jgi:ferredoxin--NADP+ reductase
MRRQISNFIDADEYVDRGACVDTCPVSAIMPEDEVPTEQARFIEINARYFRQ